MPDIDLEPHRHSHMYELRPLPRRLLIPTFLMLCLAIWLNGAWRIETWALVVFSGLFFGALPVTFPRQLLSRPKD